MTPPLSIVGRSDVGQIRRRNEDAFCVVPDKGIAVVADGMGGHPGGDVASRIAADTVARLLDEAVSGGSLDGAFVEEARPMADEAVRAAHRSIRERGREEPELDNMGTTLTAMVVHPETGAWVIGHVGDSRAYRLRNGALEQLTRDDTWVQEQIDRGDMRPESAKLSPYAHLLTQCLGLEDMPSPQILDGHAEPGDTFLLCTDGLVGMVDDDAIADLVDDRDEEEALEALIAAANEAGGHDNITAALIRLG